MAKKLITDSKFFIISGADVKLDGSPTAGADVKLNGSLTAGGKAPAKAESICELDSSLTAGADVKPNGSPTAPKPTPPFVSQEKLQKFVMEVIRNEAKKKIYKDLKIFTMGSLSYEGICPYSDVDLLAVGDKSLAKEFAKKLELKLNNIKIKWQPNLEISQTADIFDHISMFFLRALNPDDDPLVLNFKLKQSEWIRSNLTTYKKKLIEAQASRRSRYGSVGGELSPNLKFGPGGLRDTCQAIAWIGWIRKAPAKAESICELDSSPTAGGKAPAKAESICELDSSPTAGGKAPAKAESICELDSSPTAGADVKLDDSLTAGADVKLSGTPLLMLQLEQTLYKNLAHIYCVRYATQALFGVDRVNLESWKDLLRFLNKDPEYRKDFYMLLNKQFQVADLAFQNFDPDLFYKSNWDEASLSKWIFKKKVDNIFPLKNLNEDNFKIYAYYFKNIIAKKSKSDLIFLQRIYDWIKNLFLENTQDWQIDFIVDSGLGPSLFQKDWDHVSGQVQSDHYHKYIVSEHLRQTLKAVCKLQNNELDRHSLKDACSELSKKDWQLLKWVALFHDLKKGFVVDHSELGLQFVNSFAFFFKNEKKIVGNLVQNHLKLSTFAFRFEHTDQAQLKKLDDLFEASVEIKLLLIFTAADIMGSNPGSWNRWKADQLNFAYKSLMIYRNQRVAFDFKLLEGFEISPQLIEVVTEKYLKKDLDLLTSNYDDTGLKENWEVTRIDHSVWVRVFKRDDGPGSLGKILNFLYIAGLPIEQAFISTAQLTKLSKNTSNCEGYIYNWFRLPSTFEKPVAQIQKRIQFLFLQSEFEDIQFKVSIEKVLFLTENKGKLSFVFKGQDQKGVLLFISKIFGALGVSIQKAQVNTWGSRIEDVFTVLKQDFEQKDLLTKLEKSLSLAQSIKI